MDHSIDSSDSVAVQTLAPLARTESETLDQLQRLWTTYRRRGLHLRHTTGKVLNELLGSPAERQAYGDGTVRRASEQLGISKVEIYRMRRYADQFPDWFAFVSDHPSATWTSVKGMLSKAETTRSVRRNRPPSSIEGVRRTLQQLEKRLRAECKLDAAAQRKLLPALRQLTNAIRDTLGIVITIGNSDVDTTPSANSRTKAVLSDGPPVRVLPVLDSSELPATASFE